MSAGSLPGAGGHGSRGGANQDFELNLASIIDCFTVLIAFMLVTASFLSIGILDAGVAAGGQTAASTTPPPVSITVELKKDRAMEIKVQGKINSTNRVPASGAKSDEWNYDAMNAKLAEVKAQFPTVTALTLTAENDIQYKDVVKAMEASKKTIPFILLGGF